MQEQEMAVNTPVSTPETTVQNSQQSTATPVEKSVVPPVEKTYSKAQVQEFMKRRVERSHNAFFKRYGVQDLKGLDELFENSKKFSSMNDEYGKIQLRNSELMRENAFLRNNINPDKYSDIIAYFKGNDLDFSEEELLKALPSHQEWVKATPVPTTTIKTIGSEAHTVPREDEASIAGRLLGVKL